MSKSRARARVKGISIESQRACKAGGFGEKPAMEACLQKQAIRRKPEGGISLAVRNGFLGFSSDSEMFFWFFSVKYFCGFCDFCVTL